MQHASGEGDDSNAAEVKVVVLPFLPDYQLHIGLFKDVQNAPHLRQQLLAGNADFEYAFIDATSILSTRPILAACFRAINDQVNSRLRSRNVHSEVVYSLSANNNIVDAFRHFGISDTTTSLIAVKVTSASVTPGTNASEHMKQNITGTILPFTDESIVPLTDIAKIKKLYKLNASDTFGSKLSKKKMPQANGTTGLDAAGEQRPAGPMDDRAELEAVILGIMAMKGS